MDGEAAGTGSLDRLGVDGARVAVDDEVGDGMFGEQAINGVGPVFGGATIGNVARRAEPERAVARIEADAPYIGAGRAQHAGKLMEERAMRPLKKEEAPFGKGEWRSGHTRPVPGHDMLTVPMEVLIRVRPQARILR